MTTTSTGYSPCRACNAPVIGEPLCCYCEEARIENGMHDVEDLTERELDELCCIAFEDEDQSVSA